MNPELKQHFEEKGFHFVGQDMEGERMEVIELDGMLEKTHSQDQLKCTLFESIFATLQHLYVLT